MGEITKELCQESPDFFSIKPTDYGRFLLISLGTGSGKIEERYSANDAAKWGIWEWLTEGKSAPLVDVFNQANGDVTDFHISVVFRAIDSEKHYLRIQVHLFPFWEATNETKAIKTSHSFIISSVNLKA
ncbi:hypothetical protein PVL29_023810 [Vitis rotundifolia]|uniref:Uncharacterized protein n=1 Tax=Vitis rotundifolia TaxID=103349 RepID=A0AA38YQ19_VITRO|nr:hypothetical protein PVL29_023810 [Vitis rotundifolia]